MVQGLACIPPFPLVHTSLCDSPMSAPVILMFPRKKTGLHQSQRDLAATQGANVQRASLHDVQHQDILTSYQDTTCKGQPLNEAINPAPPPYHALRNTTRHHHMVIDGT